MKKLIITFNLSLALINFALSQQISNCGLEHWQSFTGYEVPDSFLTIDQVIFFGQPLVSKTTDAHSGQYAAIVQNGYVSVHGLLSYGRFEKIGQTNYFYGWPFTTRPDTLRFWYKFIPAGNDTALAAILLSKWNGNHVVIGSGIMQVFNNTTSYTLAEIPIDYSSNEAPDTIIISFISSFNSNPTSGTMLFIDDISLDYTTGLKEETNNTSETFLLNAYPNPFNPSTKISWQIPVGSWQTLKIYDLLGNEVATLIDEYKSAGKYEVEFNSSSGIQDLASGIYFYQLKAGEYINTKKMILLK
jgi:hypothetical protein